MITPEHTNRFDVAVVGGGAAGMWTALYAAEQGASVCLISRKPLAESASFRAQGGLAAALEVGDTPEQHASDTLAAGRGLCRPSAVRVLTEEAPAAVNDLISRGVKFDRNPNGELALGLEGGHGHRRIVHSDGSQTGKEITSRLRVMIENQSGLTVFEELSAMALWSDGDRCHGVLTDDGNIAATATVLATGGAAALWSRTTNPWGAIGAGPVLAQAAGAELSDLEFCQFHPTALALPGTAFDGWLITEAIRGEGATLLAGNGERFTNELAPRDAVAAAIIDRMASDGSDHVLLDLTRVEPPRFPSVFASLNEAGLDPENTPVPVSPASHYAMGGVTIDLHGRSTLTGLYAVGECSCSGLHGANRLASNSLSECFVFGRRAALAAIEERPATGKPPPEPEWRFTPPTQTTRDAVWKLAGPVRRPDELAKLRKDPYPLASAIASGALARVESRGGHRRADAPGIDPALDSIHIAFTANGELDHQRWE